MPRRSTRPRRGSTGPSLPKSRARKIRGLVALSGRLDRGGGERGSSSWARASFRGTGAPGEVLGGFTVACGTGAVEVTRAQRAGKGAQEAQTFLLGMALPARLGA